MWSRIDMPLPVREFGRPADARVEAIAGVQAPIVFNERRLRVVQMADVVFGRILRTARVQQFPYARLKFERVMAFSDDVVLVENVAEEVAIIELVDNLSRNILRQGLEPVRIVPPQCHVESDDILYLAAVDCAVADRGPGDGKAMQKGLLGLAVAAFKKGALHRGKDGFEEASSVRNARPSHPQYQVMFISVAIVLHPLWQMAWKQSA